MSERDKSGMGGEGSGPRSVEARLTELENAVKQLTGGGAGMGAGMATGQQAAAICVVCSTCSVCSVCSLCSVCIVCRMCRICQCFECSCGPCNIGG